MSSVAAINPIKTNTNFINASSPSILVLLALYQNANECCVKK
jgi:hypothetical protein